MRNPWRYKIRCVFLSQGRIRRIIARTRDDGFSFVNTNNRRTRKKRAIGITTTISSSSIARKRERKDTQSSSLALHHHHPTQFNSQNSPFFLPRHLFPLFLKDKKQRKGRKVHCFSCKHNIEEEEEQLIN